MKRTWPAILFSIAVWSPAFAGDNEQTLGRLYDQKLFIAKEVAKHNNNTASYEAITNPTGTDTGKPKSKPKVSLKVDIPPGDAPPIIRTFKREGAYSDLDVTVRDYRNRFTVVVKTTQPAQGWILTRPDNHELIAKGGVANALTFAFDVNQQYIEKMVLTVTVSVDNSTNQETIPLVNGGSNGN